MHAARPITRESVIFDFGCGPGRFALGLLAEGFEVEQYVGVDAQKAPVIWADRRISAMSPDYEFVHLEAHNERYARTGAQMHAKMPLAEGAASHAHAYSVFSHLRSSGVAWYLAELRRVLSDNGRLRITAFLEEGVPEEVENPPQYGGRVWKGPLHCVRYEVGYFFGLVEEAGLSVVEWHHGIETDGQSGLVLAPKGASNS